MFTERRTPYRASPTPFFCKGHCSAHGIWDIDLAQTKCYLLKSSSIRVYFDPPSQFLGIPLLWGISCTIIARFWNMDFYTKKDWALSHHVSSVLLLMILDIFLFPRFRQPVPTKRHNFHALRCTIPRSLSVHYITTLYIYKTTKLFMSIAVCIQLFVCCQNLVENTIWKFYCFSFCNYFYGNTSL